jgi:hypothetical protein
MVRKMPSRKRRPKMTKPAKFLAPRQERRLIPNAGRGWPNKEAILQRRPTTTDYAISTQKCSPVSHRHGQARMGAKSALRYPPATKSHRRPRLSQRGHNGKQQSTGASAKNFSTAPSRDADSVLDKLKVYRPPPPPQPPLMAGPGLAIRHRSQSIQARTEFTNRWLTPVTR